MVLMQQLTELIQRFRAQLIERAPKRGPILISDGDHTLSVGLARGEPSVSTHTATAGSWICLSPQAAPARLLNSHLRGATLRQALPFLAEPLIPLPLDQLSLAGARVSGSPRDVLVAYARTDHVPARGEGVVAASLGVAALPLILGQISDGILGYSWRDQAILSRWHDGRLEAVRVLQLQDRPRLLLALRELGEDLPREWLGEGAPPSFATIETPTLGPCPGLALAGLVVHQQGHLADLRESTLLRTLQKRSSKRVAWWATAVIWAGFAASFGWLHMEHSTRDEIAGVPREDLSTATQHLLDQATEAQVPFAPEPTLLKAHEVLAWISSLPELRYENGFRLERFRYWISQFPTSGHERDPYVGKVSLEFRVREAFNARKILESISTPGKTMADVKQPIEWNHHAGLYRLSFTLSPQRPRS